MYTLNYSCLSKLIFIYFWVKQSNCFLLIYFFYAQKKGYRLTKCYRRGGIVSKYMIFFIVWSKFEISIYLKSLNIYFFKS